MSTRPAKFSEASFFFSSCLSLESLPNRALEILESSGRPSSSFYTSSIASIDTFFLPFRS